MRLLLCAAIACCLSLFSGAAQSASSIQNKTFVLTYSHLQLGTCSDGTTNQTPRAVTQNIYVSSQGRAFAKVSSRAGNYGKDRLVEPGGGGTFHVSGNQIVGTFPQLSGATRATLTLDASGQSCSASVVIATESGKPFTWHSLRGVTCTSTGKGEISGVGCSVRDGNAFAN